MTVPLYNLTDLWNSGSTTFDAIKMSVTDSGHGSGSTLLNLGVGGISRMVSTASGTCIINKSTTSYTVPIDAATCNIVGDSTFGGGLSLFSNLAHGGLAFFYTQSPVSPSTQQALSLNNTIGTFSWYGSDGMAFQPGAFFQAVADANFSAGSSPMKFNWWTAPSGSVVPVVVSQLDSHGNFSIGNGIQQSSGSGQAFNSLSGRPIEIVASLAQPWYVAYSFANDNSNIPGLVSRKSRSNSVGTQAAVSSGSGGDNLWFMSAQGSDGTSFIASTRFDSFVDGSVSTGIVPGRWVFSTANASGVMTEAYRTDSSQATTYGGFANVSLGGTTSLVQAITTGTPWCFGSVGYSNGGSQTTYNVSAGTRGATPTTQSALQAGDQPFGLFVYGSDGSAYQQGAAITAQISNNATAGSMPIDWRFFNSAIGSASPTLQFRITHAGNVVCGSGSALSTSATDGFIYIPTCAGVPTGVPSTFTGRVPMVYDTTDNKIYVYNSGWKGGTLS